MTILHHFLHVTVIFTIGSSFKAPMDIGRCHLGKNMKRGERKKEEKEKEKRRKIRGENAKGET